MFLWSLHCRYLFGWLIDLSKFRLWDEWHIRCMHQFPGECICSVVLLQFGYIDDDRRSWRRGSFIRYSSSPSGPAVQVARKGMEGRGARARHGPRWHGGGAASGFQLAWIGCGRALLATYWMHASCMCVWAEGVYVFQKMVRQIFWSMENLFRVIKNARDTYKSSWNNSGTDRSHVRLHIPFHVMSAHLSGNTWRSMLHCTLG